MDLIDAIRDGSDLEEVKRLIESGADVNYKNDFGRSVLFFAIEHSCLDICRLLLDHGADVNHMKQNGFTPLMCAVLNYEIDIIKLLLIHGADVNPINKFDANSLYYALRRGSNNPITKLLRWRGAKYHMNTFTDIDALLLLIYCKIIQIDLLREIHTKWLS